MRLGRKILAGITMAMTLTLVGCMGSSEKLSDDIVSLSADKEVSSDGNYVVVVELKKCESELKYELSEEGKVIGSEENINEAIMKEYVSQDRKVGEYKYTLTVKDSDDNEIVKSVTVEVKDGEDEASNNKTDEKEDKDNDKKDEDKEADNKEDDSSKETSGSNTDGTEWDSNSKAYNAGDKITYKDKKYTCLQGHTSQDAWDPMSTPALWKEEK